MDEAGVCDTGDGDVIEALKIVGCCVIAAVLYGIAHDMLTAHLSVEYFTIAHPPLVPSEQPVLLALAWGVVATWWMGLILGLLLAAASRAGRWPKLRWQQLRPRVFKLMITSFALALVAGAMGIAIASNGQSPIGYWAEVIPSDRQVRFAGAMFAHSASYLVGGLGGLAVCFLTLRQRARANAHSSSSMSQ